MLRPHLQASLWCLLPGIFGLVAPNSTKECCGQPEGLLAHTIDNNNSYDRIAPVKPRRGWQSVIFEPLQNVQMSWSKFQVTSFVDFQTYLDYFHNYEGYLDKFMDSILKVPKQPLYQRFMRDVGESFITHPDTCDQPPRCRDPSKTCHKAFDPQGRKHRIRENHESLCRNRHIHACLVWHQFDRLLNMTQCLCQNYYQVKERFLESIDYVEDVTKEGQAEDESLRVRRSPGESPKWTLCTRERRPTEKERVHIRWKRLIDLLAGIGVIINSVQIKKYSKALIGSRSRIYYKIKR